MRADMTAFEKNKKKSTCKIDKAMCLCLAFTTLMYYELFFIFASKSVLNGFHL